MERNNILIDALPCSVSVGGIDTPINSCFRIGVMFETAVYDKRLTEEQRALAALRLYYKTPPSDPALALKQALWFYRCGEVEDERKAKYMQEHNIAPSKKRVYDFSQDAPLIYAAFFSQYRIDLQDLPSGALHWWKFRAMFAGLKEDNEIVRIMGVRAADTSKIKDKTEAARIRRLQAAHKIK